LFLDRDGTLIENIDYLADPDRVHVYPGATAMLRAFRDAGFALAMVTNQSGIGRGLLDRDTLQAIHRKMRRAAKRAGGTIDRIVYCPHRPDDGCDCRKPATGLLERLARHYGVSMRGVPVIGDARRDLEAASALGARPILVLTGKGSSTREALEREGQAVETYDDLLAAARQLVAGQPGGRR
jgi:D-glycero-D-manno-heptose 1,7-bisphosphate phosphatase